MSKPTAKPVLLSKKKSPKKMSRKKTKASTVKRYERRELQRLAWLKANPGMVAGKLGEQAHPVSPANQEDVAKVMAGETTGRLSSEHENVSNGPKTLEVVPDLAPEAPAMKLVAMDVTDQIGDRMDTSRDHLVPGDPGFDEPQGAA